MFSRAAHACAFCAISRTSAAASPSVRVLVAEHAIEHVQGQATQPVGLIDEDVEVVSRGDRLAIEGERRAL